MKIGQLKIKDVITMEDKIGAIEGIASACFVNGDYTPYFYENSLVEYIAIYCIEGFEIEPGDSTYDLIMSNEEFRSLILKFFYNEDLSAEENKENEEYIVIQNFIARNANLVIDFRKQKMMNGTDLRESVYEELSTLVSTIVKIGNDIGMAAKPVLEDPEVGKKMLSVLTKFDAHDVINKDSIIDVVMDIAKETGALDFHPEVREDNKKKFKTVKK